MPSTRERLVDAALAVLREKGYRSCRVQDIARRAGVAPSVLYQYFDDKADLLAEAAARRDGAPFVAMLAALDDDSPGVLSRLGAAMLSSPPLPWHGQLLQVWASTALQPEGCEPVRSGLDTLRDHLARAYDRARGPFGSPDVVSTEAFVGYATALVLGAVVAKALNIPLVPSDEAGPLMKRIERAVGPGAG